MIFYRKALLFSLVLISLVLIFLSLIATKGHAANICFDLLKGQNYELLLKSWINASENKKLNSLSYEKIHDLTKLLKELSLRLKDGENTLSQSQIQDLIKKRLEKPSALIHIQFTELFSIFDFLLQVSKKTTNQDIALTFLRSPFGFTTTKDNLEGVFNLIEELEPNIDDLVKNYLRSPIGYSITNRTKLDGVFNLIKTLWSWYYR